MAREEIRIDLTAEDDASKVIDDVAERADQLDSLDPKVEVTADTGAAESDLAGLSAKADRAATDLKKVGDSSDQSRSVLANLVGNSAQDLGELGGVAGTAGVALGQLAEYATDGNISLRGLVATAGPMLAIGVAVSFISKHFAEAKARAEELKKTNQEIAESLRAGDVEQAAQQMVEGYGDLIDQAEAAGVSIEELTRFLTDDAMTLDDLTAASTATGSEMVALAIKAGNAKESFQEQSGELATNISRQEAVQRALGDTGAAADDAADATDRLTAAYETLQGRLSDESSYLTAQDAIDAVNDAMGEAMTATATYGAESEEAQDANRRLAQQLVDSKGSVLDYAGAVAGLPEEQATEITTLIDQGQFAEAERRLAEIERTRTAHVRLEMIYGQNRPLGYPPGAPWPPSGRAAPAMASTTVNVHMPRGTRPADVIATFQSYARRNGGRLVRAPG